MYQIKTQLKDQDEVSHPPVIIASPSTIMKTAQTLCTAESVWPSLLSSQKTA